MTETNDWGSTTATAGAMEVGGIAIGSLDPVGETDWLAIDFEAGTTYEVFIASPTGDIFLDPVFVLYDASGTLVQIFDDGYGPDVAGEVTIGTSGTYYISVESWGNQGGGDYQMTVTEQGPVVLTEYSIQEIADQLTLGYWGTSRRAWNTSGDDLVAGDQDGDVDGTNDNIITFNVSAISSGYQDYARTSFELWAAIADIEFVETTGAADITFQDTDLGSAYASSSTSYISPGVREITSTTINVGSDWEGFAGSAYTLQTFIHEIGHALGLGHGGNYNGNATYNVDGTGDNEYLNDSWQATIMSYFSQSEATAVNASYAFLLTPMLADIQAVIDLYGAATDTRLGDTVYGFNNNTGDFFDLDGLSPNANYNYALTLVDHGGNDTIDLSGSSRGVVLSLEAGVASSIMGETANLFIVPGSVIENAIGTSDNDTITGNSANNTINGMGGTNTLNGGAGSDTFIGGNGIDTFFGGSGFDTVDYSSSTAAVTVDLTNGGLGSGGYADGDVYYNISRVFGSDFNDTFSGGGYFYGGAGFDTFIGGVMKGVYIGGSGFDTVDYSSSTAAVTVDLTNGGLGSGGYADGDVYYNISRVFGSDFNDTFSGGGYFYGGAGFDTFIGGATKGVYIGGSGFDTVDYSSSTAAVTVDLTNGGLGSGGYADGDVYYNISRVFGSDFNDTFSGDGYFYGGAGSDTFHDGSGNSVFIGGAGDDLFVFDDQSGIDIIWGFGAGDDMDRIDLSAATSIFDWTDLSTPANGHLYEDVLGNTIIDDLSGNTITLSGVSLSDLDAGDFIF